LASQPVGYSAVLGGSDTQRESKHHGCKIL
jgi:hypothetical protein